MVLSEHPTKWICCSFWFSPNGLYLSVAFLCGLHFRIEEKGTQKCRIRYFQLNLFSKIYQIKLFERKRNHLKDRKTRKINVQFCLFSCHSSSMCSNVCLLVFLSFHWSITLLHFCCTQVHCWCTLEYYYLSCLHSILAL